jgi:exonuclease III
MVLILSWNIAGLKTSAQRIADHYGSLEAYFGRHHADIICFQEHKIAKTALSDRSITPTILGRKSKSGGGRGNNGTTNTNSNSKKRKIQPQPPPHEEQPEILYESFWSCCTDDRYKGLNGVVTYAKLGIVRSATSTPLDDSNDNEDWNTHGRCLMTDHGAFVLFNVYVPCGGGSPSQLSTKMKFLRALRRAMQIQRNEKGRAVILVGDLNLSQRRKDIHWKWRSVYINDILQTVHKIRCQRPKTTNRGGESNNDQLVEDEKEVDLEQWMIDVADYWPSIERMLATKTAVLTKTTNPSTGDTFDKYRVVVEIDDETSTTGRRKKVYLGSPETSPEACLGRYNFAERSYHDDELNQTVIYCEANTVEVDILGELMAKVIGLPSWQNNNETLLRHIANSRYAGRNRVSPTSQWLQSILVDDGMVDAFAHLYPHAHGRFTCWNQNKNCRYVNEGARIDYTLLDRSLLPYLRAGHGSPLAVVENGGGDNTEDNNPWTEAAALQAATASGLFQPVSYHGGGMVEASRPALDTQFTNAPHTGLVYTPPTFSDHIGVSLLLDDDVFLSTAATCPGNGATEGAAAPLSPPLLELDTSDAETRRAQPHKQLKSIASFFSPRKSLADGSQQPPPQPANKQTKRVIAKVKPNRNSITFHFQKK